MTIINKIFNASQLNSRALTKAAAIVQCLYLLIYSSFLPCFGAASCQIKKLSEEKEESPGSSLTTQLSDLQTDQLSRYAYRTNQTLTAGMPEVNINAVNETAKIGSGSAISLVVPESISEAVASSASTNTFIQEGQTNNHRLIGNRNSAPLEIKHRFPTGQTNNYKQISIGFSRPMVSQNKVLKPIVNQQFVSITPRVEGVWQWGDEQTLLFIPKDNFTPSNIYKVRVENSIRDLDGNRLEKPQEWSFLTARIQTSKAIGGRIGTGEFIPLLFNSPPNKASAFAKTKLIADGKNIPLTFCSDAEVSNFYGKTPAIGKTYFALKPVDLEALKKAKDAKVVIDKGIMPEKGNLQSTNKIEYKVKWTPPVAFEGLGFSLFQKEFEPLQPWIFTFNQPLDMTSLTPDKIEVSPSLARMRVNVHDQRLYVTGETQPNTIYKFTLRSGIRGIGSEPSKSLKLIKDTTTVLTVKSAIPRLLKPDECVWIDPDGSQLFPIHSINVHRADISIYEADQTSVYETSYPNGPRAKTPLHRETIALNYRPDECVETAIDLKPYLSKTNQLLVVVKIADAPVEKKEQNYFLAGYPHPREYNCWVQSTALNLTVVSGHKNITCLVNDRKTGSPIEGATVELLTNTRESTNTYSRKKISASTSKIGLCVFDDLPPSLTVTGVTASARKDLVLVATGRGIQVRTVPIDSTLGPFIWAAAFEKPTVERETPVSFYGWVRESVDGKNISEPWTPKVPQDALVKFAVLDSQSQVIFSGTSSLTSNGGFYGRLTVPQNTSCGVCQLKLSLWKDGKQVSEQAQAAAFEIEETKGNTANSMELQRQGIAVVRPGDIVRTTLLMKAQGATAAADKTISWTSRLHQREWAPQGRSNLIFSRQICDENKATFDKVERYKSLQTKTDQNGCSTVETSFKDGLSTPAVLIVEANDGTTNTVQRTQYDVLPSNCFVGLSRHIRRSSNKQHVKIEYLVCDEQGNAVPGRPVTISINQVKTGKELFKSTSVSTEALQSVETEVEGLDTLDLIAEVKDGSERVHRANIVTKNESQTLLNSAKRQLNIDLAVEGNRAPDSNEAIINPDFVNSTGLLVFNSAATTECAPIKTFSKTLSVPFKTGSQPFGTEVYAKVYDDSSGQAQKARSAVGIAEIPGTALRRLQVSLSHANPVPQAGTETTVNLEAKNDDGSPAIGADVVLVGAEDPYFYSNTNSHFLDSLQTGYSSFTHINPMSTDRVESPLSETEAKELRFKQMTNLNMMRQGIYMSISYPEQLVESVKSYCSSILKTDANGCAKVKVPLPLNAKNYKISAFVVAEDATFEHAEKNISCTQPVKLLPVGPSYMYRHDRFDIPIKILNASPMEKQALAKAKTSSVDRFSNLGEFTIKASSKNTLLIKNAEKLGEKFALGVTTDGLNANFDFDIKRFEIPQHLSETLSSKKPLLDALDDVSLYMQSKTCNSTEQLTSRLIFLLVLKNMKGEKTFSSCCDDIAREDLCQLAKLINSGTLRWINQTEAQNLYYQSPLCHIQAAFALSLANDAGLTIENNHSFYITDRLDHLECPEGTSAQNRFRVQALGHLAWVAASKLDDNQSGDQKNETRQFANIRASAEKALQAKKIDLLDAQTAAAYALLGKQVGLYSGLQKRLIERLAVLIERGPVNVEFSKRDASTLLDSNTLQNAWLLKAACTLQIGSKSQRIKLADYLLSKLDTHGWKNYVENAACIGAIREAINCGDMSKLQTVSLPAAKVGSKVAINRTFSAADANSKVWKDSEGKWHATYGSKIAASLQFGHFSKDRQIVLVDYPPAGATALVSELSGANGEDAKDYLEKEYYLNGWYQALAIEKNEAKAYGQTLEPGKFTLSYKMRAICPGKYVIPSAKLTCPNDESEIVISKPDELIIE